MTRNKRSLTIALVVFVATAAGAVMLFWNPDGLPSFEPDVHEPKAEELFAALGPVENSSIDSFPYIVTLHSFSDGGPNPHEPYYDLQFRGTNLHVYGRATKQIPGGKRYDVITMKATHGPGLIDLCAVKQWQMTPMPEYPASQAEKFFEAKFKPLWIPPDRPVYLRIRFKDSTELFAVARDAREQLQIVPIHCKQGGAASRSIDGTEKGKTESRSIKFSVVECRGEDTTYQCNPVGVFASRGDTLAWAHPIKIKGQPKSIDVVGRTLFVTTSDNYSFYAWKNTGELLFYSDEVLAGKDPVAEILALGRKALNKDEQGPRFQESLYRFIEALVELEDLSCVPFLIDCIDTSARTIAIAGLEKFDGKPDYWTENTPRFSPAWNGIERERLTDAGLRAERERWRKAFRIQDKK